MRMRNGFAIGAAMSALVLGLGCSGSSSSGSASTTSAESGETHAATPAAGDGYQTVTVADAGHLAGMVKFGGDRPVPAMLEVTKDKEVCAQKEHYKEDLIVSENLGLANVVVSLTDIQQGKGFESTGTSRLDQSQCQFVPHVQVVPAGQTVEVYNNDGILHNIHTFSERNKAFNKAQPKFLKKVNVEFVEPEAIRVTCDAHGWMAAWIVVAEVRPLLHHAVAGCQRISVSVYVHLHHTN